MSILRAEELHQLFLDPNFTPQTVFDWLTERSAPGAPQMNVDVPKMSVQTAQTLIERLNY